MNYAYKLLEFNTLNSVELMGQRSKNELFTYGSIIRYEYVIADIWSGGVSKGDKFCIENEQTRIHDTTIALWIKHMIIRHENPVFHRIIDILWLEISSK